MELSGKMLKLMNNAGWTGGCLGINEQGIDRPIEVRSQNHTKGLGSRKKKRNRTESKKDSKETTKEKELRSKKKKRNRTESKKDDIKETNEHKKEESKEAEAFLRRIEIELTSPVEVDHKELTAIEMKLLACFGARDSKHGKRWGTVWKNFKKNLLSMNENDALTLAESLTVKGLAEKTGKKGTNWRRLVEMEKTAKRTREEVGEEMDVRQCKFGKSCVRIDCLYFHPEGRLIGEAVVAPCRYGLQCQDKDCMFRH